MRKEVLAGDRPSRPRLDIDSEEIAMMDRVLAVAIMVGSITLLLVAVKTQPAELKHVLTSGSQEMPAILLNLSRELRTVKHLLAAQKREARSQADTLVQFRAEDQRWRAAEPAGGLGLLSVARPSGEIQAFKDCSEADVPILRLMRAPCPDGHHGYDCKLRWDMQESFLPDPARWTQEWQAAQVAVVDCQRGLFDAFAARLTAAHWENEWDAQPFRISAAPPRTIGKMLHQLITINYYHMTLRKKPPLRAHPASGASGPAPTPSARTRCECRHRCVLPRRPQGHTTCRCRSPDSGGMWWS